MVFLSDIMIDQVISICSRIYQMKEKIKFFIMVYDQEYI